MKLHGKKIIAVLCGAAFLASGMMQVSAASREGESRVAKKIVKKR